MLQTISIVILLMLLFSGCTQKKEKTVVVGKPTPLEVEDNVFPVPSTPPDEEEPTPLFDDEDFLSFASKSTPLLLPTGERGSSEIEAALYDCGFSLGGPACEKDSLLIFQTDHSFNDLFSFGYFAIQKNEQSSHYVIRVDYGYSDRFFIEKAHVYSVDQLFERPTKKTDFEKFSKIGEIRISDNHLTEISQRLTESTDLVDILRVAQISGSMELLDQALQDRISQQIFDRRAELETLEPENRNSVIELWLLELQVRPDLVDKFVQSMRDSSLPELQALAEAYSSYLQPPLDDRESKDKLLELLKDPYWLTRSAAIQALSAGDDLRDGDQAQILEMLKDRHQDVARAAFEAGKKMTLEREHFDILETLFSASSPEKTREFVLFVLAESNDRKATEIMAANLGDPSDHVAQLVYEKLKIRADLDRLRREIVAHFENPHPITRRLAAKVLRHAVSKFVLKDIIEQQTLEPTRATADFQVMIELEKTRNALETALQ